eukprot:1147031-Pelagomonas_calceolata.AAC.2
MSPPSHFAALHVPSNQGAMGRPFRALCGLYFCDHISCLSSMLDKGGKAANSVVEALAVSVKVRNRTFYLLAMASMLLKPYWYENWATCPSVGALILATALARAFGAAWARACWTAGEEAEGARLAGRGFGGWPALWEGWRGHAVARGGGGACRSTRGYCLSLVGDMLAAHMLWGIAKGSRLLLLLRRRGLACRRGDAICQGNSTWKYRETLRR